MEIVKKNTLLVPESILYLFHDLDTFVKSYTLAGQPLEKDENGRFAIELPPNIPIISEYAKDWLILILQQFAIKKILYEKYLKIDWEPENNYGIFDTTGMEELDVIDLLALTALVNLHLKKPLPMPQQKTEKTTEVPDAFLDQLIEVSKLKLKTDEVSQDNRREYHFVPANYIEKVLLKESTRRGIITEYLMKGNHGLNDIKDRILPVFPRLGPLIAIGGLNVTFVLTSNGIYVSGSTGTGQFGFGFPWFTPGVFESLPPGIGIMTNGFQRIMEPKLKNTVSIVCGHQLTMFVTSDGLFACGANLVRLLGVSVNDTRKMGELVYIPHFRDATILAAYCNHVISEFTMILTSDGLYACGSNQYGELGLGIDPNVQSYIDIPARINIENVLTVACGITHTMILTLDGLFACGFNQNGATGLGRGVVMVTRPTILPNFPTTGIMSVSCGSYHTMILFQNRRLFACGPNDFGQLGLPFNPDSPSIFDPTEVTSISGVISVSCGHLHTLFLTNDGNLYISGFIGSPYINTLSREEVIQQSNMPTKVNGISNIIREPFSIIAGAVGISIALTTDGLFAWGGNRDGNIGPKNDESPFIDTPTKIPLRVGCEEKTTQSRKWNDEQEGFYDDVVERRKKPKLGNMCCLDDCFNIAVGRDPIHRRFKFCSVACYLTFQSPHHSRLCRI